MAIRVLRLLEYVFDTPETAEDHMNKWAYHDDGWPGQRMRSVALPFEVVDWVDYVTVLPLLDEEPPGRTDESLNDQVLRLAEFITVHVEGEPSNSQGAIDTAIRIICEAEGIEHDTTDDGKTQPRE